MKIKIPQGGEAPQVIVMKGQREGCFLQTLNAGCAIVFVAVVAVVVGVVYMFSRADAARYRAQALKNAQRQTVAPMSTASAPVATPAPPATPAPAPVPRPPESTFWDVDEIKDEITDARLIHVFRFSDKPVGEELIEYKPSLVVRIKPTGTTEDGRMKFSPEVLFVIETEGLTRGQTEITWRLDDAPAAMEIWRTSSDRRAAFAPSPREFLVRLVKSKKITMRYTTTLGAVRTCTIQLDGLGATIKRVTK